MKPKKIITEDFFVGNLGDIKATNEIKKIYEKNFDIKITDISKNDYSALVGGDEIPNEKVRKCYISWLDRENEMFNYIANGFEKIVQNTNKLIWNMSLDNEWQSDIQFTKYVGKGDHYDWHKDFYDEEDLDDGVTIRRISVVYCLSKKIDYSGGHFQIKTKKGEIYTTRFDYGDFIVFPSNIEHRVKPLYSGSRITMVAWYK
jgi:PKHD-type hydroxylase